MHFKPSLKKTYIKKTDLILEINLKKLYLIKNIKIKLNELSVIGTNINAAFVDEVLGRKIKRFVNDFILKKKILEKRNST